MTEAYIAATVVDNTVGVVLREAYIEAAVICSECCQLKISAVMFRYGTYVCDKQHDKRRIASGTVCGTEGTLRKVRL